MNGFSRLPILAILLLAAVFVLPCGCAGSKKSARGDYHRPKPPPAVPAKQNVALDNDLRTAASKEITTAALAGDPLIRAHAIEGMKDGIGPAADKWVIRGLGDTSPVVRFASTLAAGELKLAGAKDVLLKLAD